MVHSLFRFTPLFLLPFLLSQSVHAVTELNVPFTTQAPLGNWAQPWQDACEETSLIMVDAFYRGGGLTSQEAHDRILEVFDAKEATFSASLDEDANKMTSLINLFFSWEAEIVEHPTLEELKAEIDAGRPVIVPLYAPLLRNPYFSSRVRYHVIVLSGYDDEADVFIVQEPGTRRGLDFRYSYDTILTAMHDWLPNGKTSEGPSVAIFTAPEIGVTGHLDGDKDGLSKREEILYGTSLIKKDTDADGHADGTEVLAGYTPLVAEHTLSTGALLKTDSLPHVYLLQYGMKRHIANENIFLAHGWRWQDIVTVSERYMSTLREGSQIQE